MRQLLHLTIVDRMRRIVLTTRSGRQWLLPMISAPETSRIGPFVCRWLQDRGIDGQPVGQWLGRLSSRQETMDWLVAVDVAGRPPMAASSGLQWVPLETLTSSTSPIEYQEWAVARVLSTRDGPSVRGPFGHPAWHGDVRAWIENALGTTATPVSFDVVAYRLSSHEVVLECRTPKGRWFFKGLSRDRVSEATITVLLARLMPASFARTAALEVRPDGSAWWLMEECRGTPLTERLTSDGVVRVVEAYAGVQHTITRRLADGLDVDMPLIDLPGIVAWAKDMLAERTHEAIDDVLALAMDEACAKVGALGPYSWVAGDLDPSNVIVDGEDTRFIDLDDASVGPAPLAIATFARRLERAAAGDPRMAAVGARLVDAYEHAWTPRLHVSGLWPAIDLVSRLHECHLGWRRVETAIARGEVHGVRDIARAAIRRRVRHAAVRYREPARFS